MGKDRHAMEWINIEEELPEEGKMVLWTDGKEVTVSAYMGKSKYSLEWSGLKCNTLPITHWMPLPKPPSK